MEIVAFQRLMEDLYGDSDRQRGVPSTVARTFWMLGLKRRLVRTWEWEIVCPNPGWVPRTWQTADMRVPSVGGADYTY